MKASTLSGIVASIGLLAQVTGSAAPGEPLDPLVRTDARVVDVRPLFIDREFGEGLVPIHVAPDGVQLWVRLQQGRVLDWIATDSQMLDRVLGERDEWRGPATLLFTVMKHPTLLLTLPESLHCEGLAPIQHAPGGFQLWVRVRHGLMNEWIVTNSRALDGILGDTQGWKYPTTIRERGGKERDEIVVVGQARFGPVFWWVPVAPG